MISKNKKGRMTMDKLAQITASGFGELRNEFKGDIKKLENKIDKLDNKVTGLDNKVTGLDNKVTGLEDRVEKMEEKVDNGVDRMLIIADGMTKEFLTWKQENAFGAGIESRQDEQLKDHEVRIKKLEIV